MEISAVADGLSLLGFSTISTIFMDSSSSSSRKALLHEVVVIIVAAIIELSARCIFILKEDVCQVKR